MLRTISNASVSLIFVVIIALPLIFFSSAPWVDPVENRSAASLPSLPVRFSEVAPFIQALENFYGDHFGFRSLLISVRAKLDYFAFGRTSSPYVVIGQNNWLFFGGDDSIADFKGKRIFLPTELERWRDALLRKREWLAERGVSYVFVVAPNKQSIYPENMPDYFKRSGSTEIDQLVAYLSKTGDESLLLDLRSSLLKAKGTVPLYHVIDVHWNDFGAYLAYRAVMQGILANKKVSARLVELKDGDFAPIDRTVGDMADMMRFRPFPVTTRTMQYAGSPLPCSVSRRLDPLEDTDVTHQGKDDIADCAAGAARALIFNDSMIVAMEPYLANSFSHVRYVWEYPTLGDIKRYVELERPDIVIEERVERSLTAAPVTSLQPPIVFSSSAPPRDTGGSIREESSSEEKVVIHGWGQWQPSLPGRRLMINTNLAIDHASITIERRQDVADARGDARLSDAGFVLRLYVDATKPRPEKQIVCLWTDDPIYGAKRLGNWAKCGLDDVGRLAVQ